MCFALDVTKLNNHDHIDIIDISNALALGVTEQYNLTFEIHPLSSLEPPKEGINPRIYRYCPPLYSNFNIPSCFPTSSLYPVRDPRTA